MRLAGFTRPLTPLKAPMRRPPTPDRGRPTSSIVVHGPSAWVAAALRHAGGGLRIRRAVAHRVTM